MNGIHPKLRSKTNSLTSYKIVKWFLVKRNSKERSCTWEKHFSFCDTLQFLNTIVQWRDAHLIRVISPTGTWNICIRMRERRKRYRPKNNSRQRSRRIVVRAAGTITLTPPTTTTWCHVTSTIPCRRTRCRCRSPSPKWRWPPTNRSITSWMDIRMLRNTIRSISRQIWQLVKVSLFCLPSKTKSRIKRISAD